MSNASDFIIENGVLTEYVGNGGDVVIPEGVLEIGDHAFYPYINGISVKRYDGRINVESVVIPEGVTRIGKSAFNSCKNLKSVTTPKSLKIIGASAFYNTPWINAQDDFVILNSVLISYSGDKREVFIPEGITSISDETFSRHEEIEMVHIPASLRHIGQSAFSCCCALRDINIPESVDFIGSNAFYNTQWLNDKKEDLVIINDILYAYRGDAVTVNIPDTVRVIGAYAFGWCKEITSVNIPDSVMKIEEGAFAYCKKLKKLDIPEKITVLEKNICIYCISLTDLSFSENVKSIGESAFYGCKKLSRIQDLHNVEFIGEKAFKDCKKFSDKLGRIIIKGILFEYDKPGRTIEIPDEVCHISTDAFYSSEYVYDVTEDVERVIAPAAVFEQVWTLLKPKNKQLTAINCLKDNNLHEAVKAYLKRSKDKLVPDIIQSDDAETMMRFFSLIRKPDPDTVEQYIAEAEGKASITAFLLDYKAKNYDKNLIEIRNDKKIEIELGLRERTSADWREIFKFSNKDGCIRISGYKGKDSVVTIPESITGAPVRFIGDNAFKANTIVEQVILPSGITEIGENAFKGCKKLKSINIPDGVETIRCNAFENCTALTSLDLPDSVNFLAGFAFKGCSSLKNVKLPEKLDKITAYLFDGCNELENLTLPEGIDAVYDYAFRDSKKVSSLTIPEGVKKIGYGAFIGCRTLTELTLPSTVTEISNFAFRACTKLAKIYIPSSVVSICTGVFNGCNKLVIHTPTGSYAEQYAKENNIPFVAE